MRLGRRCLPLKEENDGGRHVKRPNVISLAAGPEAPKEKGHGLFVRGRPCIPTVSRAVTPEAVVE